MKNVKSLLGTALIGLIALLSFLLIFESKLEVHESLIPLGRMHPLLLHLPIGIFAGLALLLLVQNKEQSEALGRSISLLLLINAFLSVAVAIMGLVLSKENASDSGSLLWHKLSGVFFAYFSCLLYLFQNKLKGKFLGISYGIAFGLLLIAGHLGGEMTHGENYLFEAWESNETKPFDPEKPIFNSSIYPILENKCLSCHNDIKSKGELNLSSLTTLLKGGKNGPFWLAGNSAESHMMQRILLPEEDKKHMPPKGKPQLSFSEITLLSLWINQGADTTINTVALAPNDSLRKIIQRLHPVKNEPEIRYDFAALSVTEIEKLNTPFLKVMPLAVGSPALSASFYVSQRFDLENLKRLQEASDNIIELNLNKMPLKDEDLDLILPLTRLEKLSLNQTGITGKNLDKLSRLTSLTSLSLSGCKLDPSAIEKLGGIKTLKELYVWSTGLPQNEWNTLKKSLPDLQLNFGFQPDPNDMLRLNPVMLVNKNRVLKEDEGVILKHSLPGVNIIYTPDGSEPDSLSDVFYTKPIQVGSYATIKAMAVKPGWYASEVRSFSFFRSRAKADSAILLSPTNKEYPGHGGKTLIDQKPGDADNFKDGSWLGYKDNKAEILVKAPESDSYEGISLSYLIDQGSYIMPPVQVQLWAGNSSDELILLETQKPEQLSQGIPKQVKGSSFDLKQKYTWYKLVVTPIAKLPAWHRGKGDKGWVFLDEIYFW